MMTACRSWAIPQFGVKGGLVGAIDRCLGDRCSRPGRRVGSANGETEGRVASRPGRDGAIGSPAGRHPFVGSRSPTGRPCPQSGR